MVLGGQGPPGCVLHTPCALAGLLLFCFVGLLAMMLSASVHALVALQVPPCQLQHPWLCSMPTAYAAARSCYCFRVSTAGNR